MAKTPEERREAHRVYMQTYHAEYMAQLREKCFSKLGHVCSRCPYADKRALEFDHIAGGGNQHRKSQKNSSYARYKYILNHPEEFRVLCRNCNWIVHLESKGTSTSYVPEKPPGRPRKPVREKCDSCDRKVTGRKSQTCVDCKKECERLYMRQYTGVA